MAQGRKFGSFVNGWIILSKPLFSHTSHSHLLFLLNLPTSSTRRQYHLSILAFHIKNRTAPKCWLDGSFAHCTQPYSLRHSPTFNTPIPRTTIYLESTLFKSSKVFDTLPLWIHNAKPLKNFKKAASKFLLSTNCSCSSYPQFHWHNFSHSTQLFLFQPVFLLFSSKFALVFVVSIILLLWF